MTWRPSVGERPRRRVFTALRETLAAVAAPPADRSHDPAGITFRSLITGSTDVTVLLDPDLVIRWHSPAAERQFGLTEHDLLDRALLDLIHPEDAPAVTARLGAVLSAGIPEGTAVLMEARLRDGCGRWRETESAISDQRTVPDVAALVLQIRDIGDRREIARSTHRRTWTDPLTGLANRRKLLHAAAELRAASGMGGMVLRIGLPGYTDLRQERDRAAGDALLVEAAERLRAELGTGDIAARVDEDDFAVLVDCAPVPAYALASRLVATLSEPYSLRGTTVRLAAAAGVARLSGGLDVEDALRRAELARRRATQLGPGRTECYDESIEAALVRRMTIERELPGAIDRNELDLVFQPVLDLREEHPVGVEALLRWRSPQLGMVHPGDIIPAAESLGLDSQIGEWVLHRACRQLSRWRSGGRDLWVSINVSGRQLRADGFADMVATAIEVHGVPADRLLVELAEPRLGGSYTQGPESDPGIEDLDVMGGAGCLISQGIGAVRATGVRIALDNFGSGRAALSHLRRLPIDAIKVDRALFAGPADGQDGAPAVLGAIVELGRRLGFDVIATGLEENAHRTLALAAGCFLGEGFLLAPPTHAEHVEAFLESHRTPRFHGP